MAPLSGKSALVLITGANRGIGKEMAIQLTKLLSGADSTFLLLARNELSLQEVKEEIIKESPTICVELIIADLSQPYTGSIDDRIRHLEARYKFDIRLIIHNAGSVGDLTRRSSELNDEQQWASYLQTNLISTIHLNNMIYAALNKEGPVFIVNITSLLSIKPYPSFTQYSVAKAAREAYFRSFAVEHPKCRVLNYSPGPVDTQMHTQVVEMSYDEEVKKLFGRRYEQSDAIHRNLLSPCETVKRFIKIVEQNSFENGSRVDYFDKW
ncbi:short chain dehydrogenase domain-containing protein [Ditylenchus destructor]|uniref:Short chain dehydrogenase domain-containing protein n=1 Tax=Ditylenchus destructor TaxID=166010 RepID=A0AAD4NF44_9BILA|nr:short chain dehydrogenase domain-containing protein [Ditylenchus destructor]